MSPHAQCDTEPGTYSDERKRNMAMNCEALGGNFANSNPCMVVPGSMSSEEYRRRSLKRKQGSAPKVLKKPWNMTPGRPKSERIRAMKSANDHCDGSGHFASQRTSSFECISNGNDDGFSTSSSQGSRSSQSRGYSLANSPSMRSFNNLPYRMAKNFQLFGAVPGVPVGSLFPYRNDCRCAGIHQPLVAGISGNRTHGCHSIAVNGGYPEDRDLGDEIVFTGSGGRDLKGTKENPKNLRTAPQSRDMELNRFNEMLIKSTVTGKPIRVVRGPKCHYEYAPINLYRYDGLYTCEEYTYDAGAMGFKVYRFKCVRIPGQPPLQDLPRSMDDPAYQKIVEEVMAFRTEKEC